MDVATTIAKIHTGYALVVGGDKWKRAPSVVQSDLYLTCPIFCWSEIPEKEIDFRFNVDATASFKTWGLLGSLGIPWDPLGYLGVPFLLIAKHLGEDMVWIKEDQMYFLDLWPREKTIKSIDHKEAI